MANLTRRLLGLVLAFAVYYVVSGNKPAEPKSDSLKAELLKILQHKDQTEEVVTKQHEDNGKNVGTAKAAAVSAKELGEVVKKVKSDQDGTLKQQSNFNKKAVLEKEKDNSKQLPRVLKEAGKPNQEFRTTKEKNNVKEVPDCYVNVTLEGSGEGTLNSPQYPSNYDNELHCVYRIQTQPGYFTQLTFQDFKLEPGSACMYDSLQVFANNGTLEIPLSDEHCGNDVPVIEAVDYNLVVIVLKTDFSQTATGFLLDYRVFIPGQRCMFGAAEDCAFECHCTNDNTCNRETGACICKNEPPSNGEDDFVGDEWTGIGCQTGNVALYKPANQSGTGFSADPESAALYPMSASQATDGYSGLLDWAGHCAWVVNEDVNTRAWWIVDLGALHQVFTVTVYNTYDSEKSKTLGYISLKHSQDMPNIKIMQGCNGMISVIAPGDSHLMKCRKVARYVGIEKVIHPNATNAHTMALCEVQVMGHKYYDVDCSTNGTCAGNCYAGLYCDRCYSGYRQPECTKVEPEVADCGVPEVPLNGTVSYSDTWTGSVANYTCDVGFTLQGGESSVCDIKGLWKDVPVCEKVNCGAPPLDDSAESLDYTGTLYGDIVYYECADGYKLMGNAVVRCIENGTWDNPAPQCELMTCGSPPDLPNAYLTGITGNVLNSVATYTCDEGFLSNGESADLICDIGGNWDSEGERLQCTGVPCKAAPPPPTEHSYVSYSNGSVYTAVVEYKCVERYYMPGVEGDCFTITCMGNGRWSDIPPQCIVECGGLLTNQTGMITSPNWPDKYNSNRKCTWLIKAPRPGDKIFLEFLHFDLEMETNCSYDHMNVYESNGKVKVLLDTYCGDVIPSAISTVVILYILSIYLNLYCVSAYFIG